MYRNFGYLILLLLIACNRTPSCKKCKIGNWAVYQIGKETVLYTIIDRENAQRFWLEMTGTDFCIRALIDNGNILSLIDCDSCMMDVSNINVNPLHQKTIQMKDTIFEGKRIVIKRLNDTLIVSSHVPIFGIISCGKIHLLDFGYHTPPSLDKFIQKKPS